MITSISGLPDLSFTIEPNFNFVYQKSKGKLGSSAGSGNNLDATGKAVLSGADVGSKVYIDAKIKGPDGKITSVTSAIKVNR